MAEVVYTGGNFPVKVGTAVIMRAKSVSLSATSQLTDEYQLGTVPSLGHTEGPWTRTVEIVLNPIDTQMERAVTAIAAATDPVTLTALMAAAPVDVITPRRTIEDCVFTSVRYSASVPDTSFSATWQLTGLDKSAGGSVAAPSTAGLIAFKPKHIMVRFGTFSAMGANILRVKSMNISVTVQNNPWYEFTNEDPWYIDTLSPAVTLQLTWYGSQDGTAPGTLAYDYRPLPNASAPDDVEIQLVPDGAAWDSAGNIKIEIANIVASEDGITGSTENPVDDTITYSASDPGGTGGFNIVKIPV